MSWGEFEGSLEREATNLCESAQKHHILPPLFRDELVQHICSLLARNQSVLLVGPNGVGKTATIYGVAHARSAATGGGPIFEISTAEIMSGTKWLGEWETKATALLNEAAEIDGVIYLNDVWNLPTTGKTANNPSSLFDTLRPRLQRTSSVFIGEVTEEQLRMLERIPGFSGLFTIVNIEPLSAEHALETVRVKADGLKLALDTDSLRTVLALPRRFSPDSPPPGQALALLSNVRDYHQEKARIGEREAITPAFVERVFSIYSGLPLFIVSDSEKRTAQDIRAWFRERLIGQQEAIETVVESIALFKAGLNDPQRPIGTFMFVGPTGVGKTELARALASYLFGSVHRMLRFDLSEFTDYSSVERLIGSANDPSRPAQLLDPVRASPFQVILFDEIEKAHPNVWDLLLPLLDDGRLTPPAGRTVDFTNTIIICTSNVGASDAEKNLGFAVAGEGQNRDQKIRAKLEEAFRPEFLNRFQHIVVFHALARSQLRRIARHELKSILQRDGITARNIIVDVDDAAIDFVIDNGLDARYGARALKRELQSRLIMPLAMTLMERAPDAGTLLSVSVKNGQIKVRITDTPESRSARAKERPYKTEDGRSHTKASIFTGINEIQARLGGLADSVDETFQVSERERLIELRQDQAFWRDSEAAHKDLRDLDRINETLERLERLRERLRSLQDALDSADTRKAVGWAGERLVQLEESMSVAQRELVTIGPTGRWDCLLEISPIAAPAPLARDLLVEMYGRWAAAQHYEVDWICVPRDEEEPCIWLVKGHYAYGHLRLEQGVHRVRRGKENATCRVTVRPWLEDRVEGRVDMLEHRALKGDGLYGQRIRSKLLCHDGLHIQNSGTIAQNMDLARELLPSWIKGSKPAQDVVRRYDLQPLHIRDVATGWSTARTDALGPTSFHELLLHRIDALGQESAPKPMD